MDGLAHKNSLPKTIAVHDLVFLIVELTTVTVLDRKYIPTAAARHRTLCSFDQRCMFVIAAI